MSSRWEMRSSFLQLTRLRLPVFIAVCRPPENIGRFQKLLERDSAFWKPTRPRIRSHVLSTGEGFQWIVMKATFSLENHVLNLSHQRRNQTRSARVQQPEILDVTSHERSDHLQADSVFMAHRAHEFSWHGSIYHCLAALILLGFSLFVMGCGSASDVADSEQAARSTENSDSSSSQDVPPLSNDAVSTRSLIPDHRPQHEMSESNQPPIAPEPPPQAGSTDEPGQTINNAAKAKATQQATNQLPDDKVGEPSNAEYFQLQPVDEEAIRARGIEKHTGKYLTLYSDVRDPEVAEYVDAFDQAVSQWAEYFGVAAPRADQFQVRGCFMQDPDRFRQCGLFPSDIPEFPHGYQTDSRLWVYQKPGPYFSRHQILHEGVHAFVRRYFHGLGAPWYTEGIAELLACHKWSEGKVTTNQTIESADDAEYWGRVRIIQDACEQGTEQTLLQVMATDLSAFKVTEPYAWCWAVCHFFDRNPHYSQAFHTLPEIASDGSPKFTDEFVERLKTDEWKQIEDQWQLFIHEMEYGYDVERESITFEPSNRLSFGSKTVQVLAEQGWQSTGIEVEAGKSYEIQATGRVTLGTTPQVWESEPNGVTIHYERGFPIGMLIGAVREKGRTSNRVTPLATPTPIGQHFTLKAENDGTLFLRVNDAATSLADNQGAFEVSIRSQ